MRKCVTLAIALLLTSAAEASLDLTVRQCGISLGNSPRLTGIRINAVDDGVEAINGIDLTLWNPGLNPEAALRGVALGLIGAKARTIDGVALGGLGVVAHERLLGLGAAAFGVGTDHLWGAAAGLSLVEARESLVGVGLSGYRLEAPERVWGAAVSGWHTRAGAVTGLAFSLGLAEAAQQMRGVQVASIATAQRLNGIALGGLAAMSDTLVGVAVGGVLAGGGHGTGLTVSPLIAFHGSAARSIVVGGLAAGANRGLSGAAVSLGYAGSERRVRGFLAAGAFAQAGERLDGVSLSLGALHAGRLQGIALSGLCTTVDTAITGVATGLGFVRAGERVHGAALGGVTCLCPEVKGVSTGLFNGAIVQEINLEEFIVINKASQRHTGLAIGLVNYTRNLRGVQLGLLNWAGNNPRWLRLLPLVNLHI